MTFDEFWRNCSHCSREHEYSFRIWLIMNGYINEVYSQQEWRYLWNEYENSVLKGSDDGGT